MKQSLIVFLALACMSCISVGDGAAWARGHVIGVGSGSIEGAQVYFEACASPPIPNDTTDVKGEFRVSCTMAPGHYQTALVIDAPGYKPAYLGVPTLTRNYVIAELVPLSSRQSSRAFLQTAPAPAPSRTHAP